MFSGIIEELGVVVEIDDHGSGKEFTIRHSFCEPLYIDQSICHNGACLTVVSIKDNTYKVVAILESLRVTNLGTLKVGDHVNLERSVRMETRLDGHMVQGHVDCTGRVTNIKDENGSWEFTISYPTEHRALLIHKGSVTLNGISLTIINVTNQEIKVAIIPYTYEHTNLQYLKIGDTINIEFDTIGKYIANYINKINA